MATDRFDKIDEKLEKIDAHLDITDSTLCKQQNISEKQQLILEEHQRRSLANEKAIDILTTDFKPIKTYVDEFKGIIKFFKILAVIAALVEMVYQITHWTK